jgi:hypothetical protein
MFVALLLGAFVARLAATFDGGQRYHKHVLRHVILCPPQQIKPAKWHVFHPLAVAQLAQLDC